MNNARLLSAVYCCALSVVSLAAQPVSDQFNAPTLNNSLWTLISPVGDATYSLTGSNLLLTVPAGVNHDVWSTGDNGVRVMQAIPNTDFEVVTKIDSALTSGSQMEGILVEQDATTFLRFDLRHDGVSARLFAASITGNTGTFQVDFAVRGLTAPFWLKVNRTSDIWTESYSKDGVNYVTGGIFSFKIAATAIGVFAGNFGSPEYSAPALTASFDYFLNVVPAPDMTLTISHSGNFVEGAAGAYAITVSNSGTGPTNAPVTVTDSVPAGLTALALSGPGWICALTPAPACGREDVLAPGAAYPPLTLSVFVAGIAPATVTNAATVAGGGESRTDNDSATDLTLIQPPGTAPVIGNLTVTTAAFSATVTWTTGEAATSRVDYGLSASYGASVQDSSRLTVHSVLLNNLACATTYQYQVTAVDAAGNTASSGNQTFTTAVCTPGGPVSDNFDAPTLNTSLWTFVNPLGDAVITMNGSEAQITIPHGTGHDLWSLGNQSARLLQSVGNVDFQVELRFNSVPMYQSQIEGVMVQQDIQNYLRFDLSWNGSSLLLFSAALSGGVPNILLNMPVYPSSLGPPVWLRLNRSGNTWTESYSYDGTTYAVAATFTLALTATSLGPFAATSQGATGDTPAFTASVDYFFNSASPVANNDGPAPFDRFVIDPTPPTNTLLKALADIDGDGRPDVIIGFGNRPDSGNGPGIWWYRNPHAGNLAEPWEHYVILPNGPMYEDMTALDVNNDGAVDIIASYASGALYWFENPRGHGGDPAADFWMPHFIGNGVGENDLKVADIDGDGMPDVVTNGFVFFQNGPDSWAPVSYNRMSNGVATLDIGSGKGRIDLVGLANFFPYPLVWLENPREHGGNARTDPWIAHVIGPGYDNTGQAEPAFATGDLNGDGRMDLVSTQAEGPNGTPDSGALWWWEAPADRRTGTWIQHVIDATFANAHNIRVADMDADGTLDIVTSEQEQAPERRVCVFYNDGGGNFIERILSNGSGHNLALGDIDNDGDIDILNAGHGYYGAPHPVEIYRNRRHLSDPNGMSAAASGPSHMNRTK